MPETVHEYYKEQPFLPTYGKFLGTEDMAAFEISRREMFTDKLFLPAKMFQNARLIEFGPDTGENSLVFAMWGAECTLIEPNPKAHPVIREYFERYRLLDKLAGLEAVDILSYGKGKAPWGEFDLIDAEYSIYTVHPIKDWVEVLARLLKKDAMAIFLHMEVYGSFLELMLKVVHARLRQLTGWESLDAATRMLKTKWDMIPHKRSLQAFVMDVLENPFTRLDYLIEPVALCNTMYEAGMDLYSSWPPYKDGLRVEWVKRPLTPEEALASETQFLKRSRLSHLLGRSCFLPEADESLEKDLWNLVFATDRLIDKFDEKAVQGCVATLKRIETILSSGKVVGLEEDIQKARALTVSLEKLFDLLVHAKAEEIVDFCNRDAAFLENWGSPAHATVFRKRP